MALRAARTGARRSQQSLTPGGVKHALQLVHLYAERGSPKYEKAALRWLDPYLTEGSPRLRHFAEIARSAAGCQRRR
jgi:hypothetical protein